MKPFFSLLRLQINSQFGLTALRYAFKSDRKMLWKVIGIGLIILVSVGQLVVYYTILLNMIYSASLPLNSPELILTLGAVAAGVITLVFGIIYILSTLFFAKDTELLSALPLPQSHIFTAKFALVLLMEYPSTLFLMLPPVLLFGIRSGAGVAYYLAALICILLLPLLPLLAASLVSLLVMKGISRIRHRNFLLTALGFLLVISIIAGQNLLIARIPAENAQDFFAGVINGTRSLIDLVGRAFFPAILITRALVSPMPASLLYLLALLGISAAVLVLVWLLSSVVFQQGATAQLETAKTNRAAMIRYRHSSPVMTFFKLEWKNLLRVPVYALNSLLQIVLFPVLMLLPLFSGSLNDPDLAMLYNFIKSEGQSSVLILVSAGILAFCSVMNTGVSTSFSREGKLFWVLKSVPVPASTQVAGKFLTGYSITFITIVLTALAMGFAFKLPPVLLTLGALLAMVFTTTPTALTLLIDLMRPKLAWNNPQEAIKQNLNAVLSMFVSIACIALFAGIAAIILFLGAGAALTYIVLLAASLAASYASVTVLLRSAQSRYERIEV